MPRQFNSDTRQFDEVPADWELQYNAESKRWDYAPPGSIPRFLEERGEWVLAPASWTLVADETLGKPRFGPPRGGGAAPAADNGIAGAERPREAAGERWDTSGRGRPAGAQGLQDGDEGEPAAEMRRPR